MATAVAIVAMLLGAAPASADGRPRHRSSAERQPYGHSYSEWAARWWQWAVDSAGDQPADRSRRGSANEEGKVWFLAGAFTGEPVTRSCTVPKNTASPFPVVNEIYRAEPDDPADERTVVSAREQVADVAGATGLTATNGVPVSDRGNTSRSPRCSRSGCRRQVRCPRARRVFGSAMR